MEYRRKYLGPRGKRLGENVEYRMRMGFMIFTPHQIEFGCPNLAGCGWGAGFLPRVGEERVIVGKVSNSIRGTKQRWEDNIKTRCNLL
jgi:hypothetical protein